MSSLKALNDQAIMGSKVDLRIAAEKTVEEFVAS